MAPLEYTAELAAEMLDRQNRPLRLVVRARAGEIVGVRRRDGAPFSTAEFKTLLSIDEETEFLFWATVDAAIDTRSRITFAVTPELLPVAGR